MKKPRKRILIGDDHGIVRKGVIQVLQLELDDPLIAEAEDSRGLLELAAQEEWDLMIVDIRLPGRSGLDILPDLLSLRPDTPICVISAFSEQEYGVKAFRGGAQAFIHKSHVSEELIPATKKLLVGKRYVSPSLAACLADSLSSEAADLPHDQLSEREFEVMRLIALGHEIQEIAHELALSPNTIGTYRARIYRKLEVKNNVEISRYAMQHKLVD